MNVNVKVMYSVFILLLIPIILTIFFGVSWIRFREAKHSQQTNPNPAASRKLKIWKILLIISGILFGAVLLAELAVIIIMAAVILFS